MERWQSEHKGGGAYILRIQAGFTLYEILIVLAIVSILAAVIFPQLQDIREKARDRERMQDLSQLQIALRLYADKYGTYPEAGCNQSSWASEGTGNGGECEEYIVGLAPEFIPELPRDPVHDRYGFGYKVDGEGYKVTLFRSVENLLVDDNTHEYARCPASCGNSFCDASHSAFSTTYAVYNNAGQCF